MSDDYEVGYKKPPVATRFGGPKENHRGRGRKSKNLKTELREELAQSIRTTVDGKTVRITKLRALVKALTHAGIKGNDRATSKVLELVLRLFGVEEDAEPQPDLSAQDQAILDAFLGRKGDGDAE